LRAQTGKCGTQEPGGDDGDYDFGVGDGSVVGGDVELRGRGKPGRKSMFFARHRSLADLFKRSATEDDLVAAAAVSERAMAVPQAPDQNSNTAMRFFLAPKRGFSAGQQAPDVLGDV